MNAMYMMAARWIGRSAAISLAALAISAARPASAAWSSWQYVFGGVASDPSAVAWNNGRNVDVFVVGTDSKLYCYHSNPNWWEQIAGSPNCIYKPCAMVRNQSQMDVFVVASDHQLWHWETSTFGYTYWERLGGYCVSAPSACTDGYNRMDCFVLGSNNVLYDYAGQLFGQYVFWSSPSGIGGGCAGDPAAASAWSFRTGDQPNVVVIGTDHALWHWDAYDGWDKVGGYCTGSPAMISTHGAYYGDRLDVAVIGGSPYHDFHIAWNVYYRSWSAWDELFYSSVYHLYEWNNGAPCLVSWSGNAGTRLDAFESHDFDANGYTLGIHSGFDGIAWSPIDYHSMYPYHSTGTPAAVSPGWGQLVWWMRDNQGHLWEKRYTQ